MTYRWKKIKSYYKYIPINFILHIHNPSSNITKSFSAENVSATTIYLKVRQKLYLQSHSQFVLK